MSRTSEISDMADELVPEMLQFARELIEIPTVNPPGENYQPCSELIAGRLREFGFEVYASEADGHPDHSAMHPRINVIGTRRGRSARPMLHLNGHIDVVPAGAGWTRNPFAAVIEDDKMYGRGSSDMKCRSEEHTSELQSRFGTSYAA